MGYRRSDWPLTDAQLAHVIELGETTLVEFKREWPLLNQREGQAKLARQVMALANAVGPDELGLLLFGIDDDRRAGQRFGVIDPPQPEAIAQILGSYVQPPVNVQCRHYALEAGVVSAVAVLHSHVRPHYCIRECPPVLSTRAVYVRRDKQVGVLTPPELERMIREKDAGLGAAHSLDPVAFGFVELPMSRPPKVIAQVRNLTTEPLTEVSVSFDARFFRDPSLCHRARVLVNATLNPEEACEVTWSAQTADFYKIIWTGSPPSREHVYLRDRNLIGDGWLDVAATLTFRGQDGMMHSRRVEVPLDV